MLRDTEGTEAKLRYMEPALEGNYGPYWEGSVEKQGYTYTLSVPLALRRPGTEMEVMLGLSGCQGHRVKIGIRAPTRVGEMRGGPFYRPPVFASGVVRTDPETGKAAFGDLVGMVRELSRLFGVSMPDGRLAEYV
jgi:hypothetical protein